MRIDWFSNSPFATTGYGNQTRLFAPLIKELGHEISIHAFFGHDPYSMPINWNGIEIMGRGFHPYGLDVITARARTVKADIVLTLLDAWIFDPMQFGELRWVPWFPVDHDPVPPAVLERVRYAFARLVYSRFGEKQLEEHGVDCVYVPHGVNTSAFKPVPPGDKPKARQALGLPADAFVVGMVAANKGFPSRKAFEQNIAAFKMLADKHRDVILWLQTWTGEGAADAVDLPAYCRNIGLQLGKNVIFCDQTANIMGGFPDPYMVLLYNSFDVLLSVSRGEGFGIPILEAQACGVPVITGNWTSMGELTFAGWKVEQYEATKDYTRQNSYQFLPDVGAIFERLEAAYSNTTDMSERAREGAEKFDIHHVTEKYWRPALDAISKKIERIESLRAQVAAPAPAPATPAGNVDVTEISA